jgi:two-component system, NarL family, sensor kinase
VTAVGRDDRVPDDVRDDLQQAGHSLRTSLKALRSLLVSIHPPDLHADGLAAALTDLSAPAATAQIDTNVHVSDIGQVPDDTVRLVWRVAQEAVRNAIRHADATTLEVDVHRQDDRLVLRVVDDGQGFDVNGERDPASFGLRGLASLVKDEGGRLDVRSTPGGGTEVRMEVRIG